jgi:hypothetical protein
VFDSSKVVFEGVDLDAFALAVDGKFISGTGIQAGGEPSSLLLDHLLFMKRRVLFPI